MIVLKAVLKLLELFVNGDNNSTSGNNALNSSNTQPNQQSTPQLETNSLKIDQSARLEQMWEVYNRVIKMKEEQARSDAEEIVKLKFKIEDLKEELSRERRIVEELKKELKTQRQPNPPNNSKTDDDSSSC